MDMQIDGYAYESFLRGQNKVPKDFFDDVLILAYSAPPELGRSRAVLERGDRLASVEVYLD